MSGVVGTMWRDPPQPWMEHWFVVPSDEDARGLGLALETRGHSVTVLRRMVDGNWSVESRTTHDVDRATMDYLAMRHGGVYDQGGERAYQDRYQRRMRTIRDGFRAVFGLGRRR